MNRKFYLVKALQEKVLVGNDISASKSWKKLRGNAAEAAWDLHQLPHDSQHLYGEGAGCLCARTLFRLLLLGFLGLEVDRPQYKHLER